MSPMPAEDKTWPAISQLWHMPRLSPKGLQKHPMLCFPAMGSKRPLLHTLHMGDEDRGNRAEPQGMRRKASSPKSEPGACSSGGHVLRKGHS